VVYSVDLDPIPIVKGAVAVHSLTGMCIGSDSDKGSWQHARELLTFAAGAYYIISYT